MRSTKSSGISGIVDAVRGEGRTGRAGFVSMLKERIKDSESGIGAPFALNGELGPTRFRRMVNALNVSNNVLPADSHMYNPRPIGRLAVRPAKVKGQVCRQSFGNYGSFGVSIRLRMTWRMRGVRSRSCAQFCRCGRSRKKVVSLSGLFPTHRGSCAASAK